MSREYKVIDVTGEAVTLRVRRRIPWDKIISLLLEGHEVFVDCDRRGAYYIRRQLERRLGELVEAYPSEFQGMTGYTFKLSIVQRFLGLGGGGERGEGAAG